MLLGGLLLTGLFQVGSSMISSYATKKELIDQYSKACDFYNKLHAEVVASQAMLDEIGRDISTAEAASKYLAEYEARVRSLADNLEAQKSPYQRSLLIMCVAQAIGAMILIYFLVRQKEKRDSILDFL